MKMTTLGRTGMQVSQLCLGTMMFGVAGNPDVADCKRIVHAALDAGVNFIDTADVYGRGESETIVGKALAGGRREAVILATKVHFPMAADANMKGNSKRWIRKAVEGSLRRLNTDWIDLYQIHRPDPNCDIDETLGVLSDLIREGKLRAIGTSTFPAWQLVEAQWVSERRHRERFVTEQSPYSILTRAIEADVLPACEQFGIGMLVWSPLGGGWLAGKFSRGQLPAANWRTRINPARFDTESESGQLKLDIVDRLRSIADAYSMTLIELALRFVLEHRAVNSAIIGPRTMDQLVTQLAAPERRLSAAILDAIDKIVPPGQLISAADFGYVPPSLVENERRRRPPD